MDLLIYHLFYIGLIWGSSHCSSLPSFHERETNHADVFRMPMDLCFVCTSCISGYLLQMMHLLLANAYLEQIPILQPPCPSLSAWISTSLCPTSLPFPSRSALPCSCHISAAPSSDYFYSVQAEHLTIQLFLAQRLTHYGILCQLKITTVMILQGKLGLASWMQSSFKMD